MLRFKFCKNVSSLLIFENKTLIKYGRNNFVAQIRSVSNYEVEEKREDNLTSLFKNSKKFRNYDEFDEKSFLLRLKKDPDSFGKPPEPETLDEGDIAEEKRFAEQTLPTKKLSSKQYSDIIKDLIKKRKIKEAVDVLEERMLKEDRVKPENYIFNLVIGALGRVGYTKKAFSLYNRMKERGLKVHISTYTALFNACANSPFPEKDGLPRAQKLKELMTEKGVQPNDSVYNSMIKAFGRCGDLNTAFAIVDEMYKQQFPVKVETLNFLLQACISDKQSGFRHSLLVWRKMIEKNIKPDVFTYNLLLRCTRDCGLGDLEVTKDVIEKIVGDNTHLSVNFEQNIIERTKETLLLQIDHQTVPKLDNKLTLLSLSNKIQVGVETVDSDTSETKHDNLDSSDLETIKDLTHFPDPRPNLLAFKPHLGNVLSLEEVRRPEDRLLLLGGYTGFLKNMSENNCKPDLKTFTQLLECVPNSIPLEKDLILKMKEGEIVADIDFFNILMKKRSLRFDYDGAKEVLKVMKKMKYRPDVVTYGVLAMGCTTKEKALELINDMKEHNYSLNAEIMGTLVHQGCHHGDFEYLTEIMDICLKDNIVINKKFREHLDRFKRAYRYNMNSGKLSKKQEKKFVTWKSKYKGFLEQIRMDETEDLHPWRQYETETEGQERFEWGDNKSRFKPRHISKFKVKTSKKIRY